MPSTIADALTCLTRDTEETFLCSSCNQKHSVSERQLVGEEEICEACCDEHTITCESCGERIWSDDNAGSGDLPLCQRCYERYQIGAIHNYSCKPDPIFYGDDARYFGVELEIDGGGKDGSHARELLTLANHTAEHLYIKSDGSLDDGMELITHPCTLAYHANHLPWPGIINRALGLNYLSHKTSTCGLHIHMNRSAFSDEYERQEACIGRVLFFMEKHWDELLKFSRRTEAQLGRWAVR